MTRGLVWLPLLGLFCWLAWAGWNEYQKLEAYRTWAEQFDHAKYDIYAVLGQKGSDLTWGKPSRRGPTNLQTFSLQQTEAIRLRVGKRLINCDQFDQLEQLSGNNRQVALEFQMPSTVVSIPFTDVALAAKWGKHLQEDSQKGQQETV